MNDHKATVQFTVENSCGDHDDDVYLALGLLYANSLSGKG